MAVFPTPTDCITLIKSNNRAERKYCMEHSGYNLLESRQEAAYSGSYFQSFNVAGVYFFQTQSTKESSAFCVVQVVEKAREHMLDVKDVGFTKPLYEISAGERIWVHWRQSKTSSTTPHTIIVKQICEVGRTTGVENSVVAEDSNPARPAGLFSHVFEKPGVYEICDGERPHMKSVIIVKATPKQHVVKITADEFAPALGTVTEGDRIWWTWSGEKMKEDFSLVKIKTDKISQKIVISDSEGHCKKPEPVFRALLRSVGVFSLQVDSCGLLTFTDSKPADDASSHKWCCLISQPSSKHHEVKLRETRFEPHSIRLKKGDIVLWKWLDVSNVSGMNQVGFLVFF
jgi:plastocyanin